MRPCFVCHLLADAAVVMHSISIAIPTEAADKLRDLARRERRSPRQQAAVLVLAALDREGTSPEPQSDGERPSKTRSASGMVKP